MSQHADSSRQGASGYRIPVLLLLSLIAYGSLYPFTWNFTTQQAFNYSLAGRAGLSDLVENIVLFLPLCWILGWRHQALQCRRVEAAGWLAAIAAAAVLAGKFLFVGQSPGLSVVFGIGVGAVAWLPFASSLENSIESVIRTTAFECLCFGAILWAATRSGALLGGTTAMVAALAFGCEWEQRYLPGRTPEITALLLAVAMGWLVAALRNARTQLGDSVAR
ncbi:MAG: hypothetical protein Q8L93_05335 [Rhodocyclaceae bacterium]|nr:hypothetical protein [Rhodocyclaceae bacterium]